MAVLPSRSDLTARGRRLLGRLPLPSPGIRWEQSAGQVGWSRRHLKSWASRNWREVALVVLLTAVAGVLRIYRVADLPAGLHGDEAWTGLDALRVLNEGWIGPYVGSGLGQPTGPLYVTALVFWLSGPTLFTLHLSMALLGTATVPVAYILFRLGFGRWVALMAAVALTFSYWHLFYSRSAFMLIAMPLVTTLAATALLIAVRSRSPWAWGIAGITLGVGMYTYNGYVIFLPVVAVLLGVVLVLERREWRRTAWGTAVLCLTFLLVALPLLRLAISDPDFYFQRHRTVSALQDPELRDAASLGDLASYWARRAAAAAALPVYHPAVDHSDGMGGKGVLDPILGLFAYLGLLVAVRRWRSPPHLTLALVFGAGLASVLLGLQDWGEYRRAFVAVPFIYGLASLGIVAACRWAVEPLEAARRTRAAYAMGTAMLAASVALSLWTYFGRITHEEHLDWVYATPLVGALEAAHQAGPPGVIYWYSARWSYDYAPRRFLYPDTPGIDRSKEFGTFSMRRLHDGPVTYILFPPYERELADLRTQYPEGEETVGGGAGGVPAIRIYRLP